MNREALDGHCERGILALVLTILVLGPLALGAVRGLEFAAVQGLTAGVMVLWLVRLWLNPRPQLLWPPICWAVLAFTVYALARYLTADVEYVARQEVLRVLVYAFLFFAILNNLHRQESTTIISFTVIFLGLAIAAYAVYQFLSGSDRVWTFIKPYPRRGSGTYICPNHLGGFLEMLLPLALAYTITGRLKPLTRVFLGYAALVILAGIAVTMSRGAWISTGLALVLFFGLLMLRRQFRLPAVVLLLVLVGIGAWLLPKSFYLKERVNDLVTQEGQVNDDMRFSLWEPAVRMWKDHPWWGVGPAHFDTRFRFYRPEGVQAAPDRAHNDYLNTLADWGLSGALLVAAAWVLMAAGVLKTWRSPRLAATDLGSKPTSNKYAFMLGASLGVLAILIHSGVDFNMHIPANAILVVTLMALLSGHLRFATEDYWARAGALSRTIATLAVLSGLVWLVPQAWRHASEFVWLERASRAPAFSARQIQLLEQANKIEPMNAETTFAIADALRRQSQEGGESYVGQEGVNYRGLAERAMRWFERGMVLNPYDSRNYSGYGWCLDWLDRPAESATYFARAEQLDPNNYFNLNNIGLHYIQAGDFAAAKPWFERSLRLEWRGNEIARNYLLIAQARLLEAATNEISARLLLPPQ